METESTPLLQRPAPWDPRRSAIAGGLVLVTLTLERLAFYALVANLFLFLSLGGWSPRGSMTAVLILVGVAHFSALGGGWLADGLVKYGGADSLRKFFNWYYWCVNTGSLLGVGALSYVALDMTDGFLRAFAGTGGCLLMALILFSLGRPYYLVHRPAGSVLRSILCILRDAIGGCCCQPGQGSIQSSPVLERHNLLSQQSAGHQSPVSTAQAPSWLDYAKIRYGGSHHDAAVEDVKRLGIILILFTSLLPYWLVFFQIETGFQEQGLHLKIGFPQEGKGSNFNMPTAWLSLFDQVFILALIPLMNGIIYPTLDKIGVRVSLLTRIATGMGFSLLAAVSAGVLEFFSVQQWREGYGVIQVIHNWTYNASDISLLWQIPQYCLVGSAEVFAGVAGLEFAYSAAPRPLQGVAMGMFSAMEGVGSLLGTTLISALSPVWIRHDSQHFQGHLDYYFFLLAGIQGVAFVLFASWLVVRRYRIRQEIPGDITT
ncbi:solute carrier family 15 member 4-like isoform X2 [Zootermopsis nevadensis]|uniref:solute carrier family 15 member 4-like isoform X2 n=1 Tax=Zootermopsis nevadensis TaxID=136037 RepID=UPI000B8EE491|nr:solute carrier family 15 member 4-like isoform X2 [Zootermopsis nevadensis]